MDVGADIENKVIKDMERNEKKIHKIIQKQIPIKIVKENQSSTKEIKSRTQSEVEFKISNRWNWDLMSKPSGKEKAIMAIHNQPFSKLTKRWQCVHIKRIATPAKSRDWQYLLETLAQELYDLGHQLQDARPIRPGDNTRSYSLPCLGEHLKTKTPAGSPAGEIGAWNGKSSIKHAA